MTWHVIVPSALFLFDSTGNCSSVWWLLFFVVVLFFLIFPQSRVSQQLKSSLFLLILSWTHAPMPTWPAQSEFSSVQFSLSCSMSPLPVTTRHASYILLLKLLFEHVPPRSLLTLAIYRLKVEVNIIASKTTTKPY